MAARLTEEQNTERLALYEQGFLDYQIAEKVGVSQVAITRWRNKRGLTPHGRANPTKGTKRSSAAA